MAESPNTQGASWEVTLAPEGTALAAFQKERTDAISEMFDSKDELGIYQTSRFFARLDNIVAELLSKERAEGERRGAVKAANYLRDEAMLPENNSVVMSNDQFTKLMDRACEYVARTLPADSTEK